MSTISRYAQQQRQQEAIENELFKPRFTPRGSNNPLSTVDLMRKEARNKTLIYFMGVAGLETEPYEKAAAKRLTQIDSIVDSLTLTPASKVQKLAALQKEHAKINGEMVIKAMGIMESAHNADEKKINERTAQQIQDAREIRSTLRDVPENELLTMAKQSPEMAAALSNMNRFIVGTHKAQLDDGKGGKTVKQMYGMQESTQQVIRDHHMRHVLGSEGAQAYVDRNKQMSNLLALSGELAESDHRFRALHTLAEGIK
ncbi:hypothetical protein ABFV67_11395 [Vibrio metschnikovii]|uniref:Tellurite resistance protein n=1 Tax=bacterium 19PA01SH03 TaxID=2920705 RepID=A0AAU6SP54_UNCXX|nr:hypothetical protein [Vibrio metschnikovii]EKO3683603.1 hypothetical protein [Vibrio metschnikovii]EKO3739409.1 hypothetical protein [Vibrio metschnikovii]EKO3873010.1 hypothetical protein [Vibrio metschnikovii]EKO3882738.1 hypothetical protein [Vibrio metschnikovii]